MRLKKKLEGQSRNDPIFDGVEKMQDSDLDQYLEQEWTRAKELDGKLAKLTTTLSIGVTLGGVASKLIVGQLGSAPGRNVFLTFVVVSLVLFLLGAMLGFNGLRPKPRFGYGPPYLNKIAEGGSAARNARELAIEGFIITNLIRNNEASAAIDLIRNGILFYGLAVVLSFPLAGAKLQLQAEQGCLSETKQVDQQAPIKGTAPTATNEMVLPESADKKDPEQIDENPTGLSHESDVVTDSFVITPVPECEDAPGEDC